MKEIRLLKTLAHLVFLVLFVYAAVFYLIRLNSDTSFFSFKILTFGKFNIEAGRYTSFISQIIPLIFIKLHLGLKAVLISYSVSIVLVFYGIFLLSLYAFGSIRAGLLGSLMLIVGVSDTSTYAVTEIFIGMMFSVLFYAFLEYYFKNESGFSPIRKRILLFLGIFLIPVCMFSHPSTMFPLLYIIVFQVIDKKLWKSSIVYILLFVAILVYGLKYLSIDTNSYEGDQISTLGNIKGILLNFTNLNSVHFFVKFLFKGIYILPVTMFLITIFYYFLLGDFLKLGFSILGTMGFFVLLMIIFSRGDSDLGMEKNLIPLWIFIALPFIHDVLFHDFKIPYLKPIVYALVAVSGLASFYRAAVIYGNRASYIKEIAEFAYETTGSRKIIIDKKNLNMDKLGSVWSIANESFLMTAVDGPEHAKTIYLVGSEQELNDIDRSKSDVYLCVPFWRDWGYSGLNPDYFQLPDKPYAVLETYFGGK